jgi:hypothetical protein
LEAAAAKLNFTARLFGAALAKAFSSLASS